MARLSLVALALGGLCTLFAMQAAKAEKDMELYCAACHMLVDELFFARRAHNPKKKLEIGNFRLDANGKTNTRSVDFLTSEAYLTELMESVCSEADKYIQNTNPSGKRVFKRMQSRDGTPLGLNNITYNPDALAALRHYCDNTVEVFEEELLELFRENHPDIKNHFCMDITKYCDEKADHPFAAVDKKAAKDEEKRLKREKRKEEKARKKAEKEAAAAREDL